MKKKERPKYNMWQNTGYMLKEAWSTYKSVIFLCLITVVLSILISLTELFIAPTILKKVESKVSLNELLGSIVVFTSLLLVLSSIQAYLETNVLFGRVGVRSSLITKTNYKCCITSYPNTESTSVLRKAELAENSLASNSAGTEVIWKTLCDLLKNLFGFIIYLFLLSNVDLKLIFIVMVTTLISYFVTKMVNEWTYRFRDEESAYGAKIYYISQRAHDFALAKDIRIFGMRTWLNDLYHSTVLLYDSLILKKQRRFLIAHLVNVIATFLRSGVAYYYLIARTLRLNLPASEFLLYFTAINGFTEWITGILTNLSNLHKNSLDISNLRDYLEIPECFSLNSGKPIHKEDYSSYQIELKNVSFSYPEAKKDTIHNMNLVIHPGEKLAIVGLNGAGKTTLIKLLCGFYEPTEGEILLNGVNIKEYNRTDYYKLFAAVFQQFSVLNVSVAENIAQSCENIDMDRVKSCAKKAGLTKKIDRLPNGYDTHIGREVFEDGVELSGGEVQRLMLARALYKDAPILVLDEPTAALDPISENDLYLKYKDMTKGCTSLFISHRLASTRFCDRIILLENGSIVEEGTHESLINYGQKYFELFQIQSRYYKEGGNESEE